MRDPHLIPHEAFEANTVNKPDRSAQYRSAIHKSPDKLLEAVNATGAIARSAKFQADRLQSQMNLKLRYSIYTAVITGAIARAPEIYRGFLWLLRHWL